MLALKDISNDKSTKAVVITVSRKQKEQIEAGNLNLILAVSGEDQTYPIGLTHKSHIVSGSDLSVNSQETLPIKSSSPDLRDNSQGHNGILRVASENCQNHETLETKKFRLEDIMEKYNALATKNGWPRSRVLSTDLIKRMGPALKRFPTSEEWDVIMKGWDSDDFWAGRIESKRVNANIKTMLYSSRYEDFYNLGMAVQEGEIKPSREQRVSAFIKKVQEDDEKALEEFYAKARALKEAAKAQEQSC